MWIAIIEAEDLSQALAEAWIRQSDQHIRDPVAALAIESLDLDCAERCAGPAYSGAASPTFRNKNEDTVIPEIIRYRISADRTERFLHDYAQAGRALKQSPHCQGFELMRSTKDAELFLLVIRWDSADGHLKGFRTSPEFRDFFTHIRPYVGDILEMEHYAYTEVLG
jgi:quinol monooxygenase YgiN